MRSRLFAGVLTVALGAAVAGAVPSSAASGGGAGRAAGVDQPGVTKNTIRVGAIASKTNPIGNRFDALFDGIEAYFNLVNRQGGIYGRKLKLVSKRDDQLANNRSEVAGLLERDNVFAAFVSSALFTGADLLVEEGIPTFGYNINAEFKDAPNLFGEKGSFIDFTGALPERPYLVREAGAERVAVLGYNVPQSKDCATGIENSFEKFPTAEIVYLDTSLPFGLTDVSAQVARMKEERVDFVLVCFDTNGALTVAREMRKQELEAPMWLPGAYNHEFLREFGDELAGSYVLIEFTPFEEKQKPEGLRQFLAQMKKLGKEPHEIAVAGWIGADMLVTGLRAAGEDFTRQKVIDEINKLTNFTAGGISYGIDWTVEHSGNPERLCYVHMRIKKDGSLVRSSGEPGKPFVCFDRDADRIPAQPEVFGTT